MELLGIWPTLTIKALKKLRRRYDPKLFFLMETRNGQEVLEKLRRIVRYDNYVYIDPKGLNGGLALWWRNEVKVKVLKVTNICIDSFVTMKEKKTVSK